MAADARAAPEDLAAYATVADRLLRYEYHGAGRDLPWLLAQCSGDWVLRVDADELASPMLLAVLP
ncbi:MAG TPA: hypothetical protein VGY97_10040, partial [Solirubrobacteraceae bacterium]|nr:hypothetical protein [Solirubrobacteraceae bacterium]